MAKKISEMVVRDPWPVRARELLARMFVCSWRRHDRPPAFGGGLKSCRRCSS